jgi:hypothetical protein
MDRLHSDAMDARNSIARVRTRLEETGYLRVGIAKAYLSLLQDPVHEMTLTGKYTSLAKLDSFKAGPRDQYASLYGDMTG